MAAVRFLEMGMAKPKKKRGENAGRMVCFDC